MLASQLRAPLDLVDRLLVHVGDLGKHSHVGGGFRRGRTISTATTSVHLVSEAILYALLLRSAWRGKDE